MTTHVHKFGGTSVKGPDRLRAAAAILIAAANAGERTVAVSSAMAGVTNDLIDIAKAAADAHPDAALAKTNALRQLHLAAAADLGATEDTHPLRADINALADELEAIVRAAAALTELSPRAHDRLIITGEKLAVRLLAFALNQAGTPATPLDADTFLDTDANHTNAEPVRDVADREIATAINAALDDGAIPIITGFCGRAPDGATTTLGRGGSDLSATLVAAALRADKCTIWTDVPGVYSADPRIVANPKLLERLHYREAAEMSYYGAKVLHPRTIAPVARLRIPVLVRSSLEPDEPGTVIDASLATQAHPIKAVTAIRAQCLVSIEGNGMTGVPGVAARAFAALADARVSATMISQASSEASICFAIPNDAAQNAETTLKRAFRDELSHGLVEEIVVRQDIGLVAAVGIGMAHHPGVSGRVFSALGDARVNVLAIAQGSSELNISFAVDDHDVNDAVRAIHDNLIARAPAVAPRTASAEPRPIVLLGLGAVGRAIIDIAAATPSFPIAAVADSSALLPAHARAFSNDALADVITHKRRADPIAKLDGAIPYKATPLAQSLASLGLERPILIDATSAQDHDALFIAAMEAGFDVATANKNPLAVPAARYRALTAAARNTERTLRAEATVGAGLPVLSTIESLLATGDTIRKIEACLSGTLGFLISRIDNGSPLSAALEEAISRGYTEPDPATDLSGHDVARKALILSRLAGLDDDPELTVAPFIQDDALAGLSRDDFLAAIRAHDDDLASRASAAARNSRAIRYVTTVEQGAAHVALSEVRADHPLASLRGPDNMIVITTDRYPESNPLTIRGSGAGATVTAAGILTDVHLLSR